MQCMLERDSILPRFPPASGYTEETLFRKECERWPEAPLWRTHSERRMGSLYVQAGVIIQRGLPAYFLIVQEYIRWARENMVLP